MKQQRKIAVVTGTRAEYGLLYRLMREIADDADLILQLIVTGMHLSPEFGLSYQLIEADGFKIDAKVEMLLSSDTAVGITKSIALGILGFSEVFSQLAPDVVVLLGDRFETLSVAQTALIHRIPIAHIHGGELSAGAVDDAIRHAISKMSHLHFVAAEPYRNRVIQMGENPAYVFNVGAPGLERIAKNTLRSQSELENHLGLTLGKTNFLISYHPATLAIEQNAAALQSLFAALDQFPDANLIFSKANADEAGRYINLKIDEYVARYGARAVAYKTLGDLNYLSLLQFVDVVIGNSSSGIIEVPWFNKPSINIGNRQQNRLRAASVIDCDGKTEDIVAAIHHALSAAFKAQIKNQVLPYKQGATAQKIKTILKNQNLKQLIVKQFYDLPSQMAYSHDHATS